MWRLAYWFYPEFHIADIRQTNTSRIRTFKTSAVIVV